MKPLSPYQVQYVISLLQAGHSVRHIARAASRSVGTVTNIRKKYLSDLPKSFGGRPTKLSNHDIRHATRLLGSGEAETAPQVAKRLEEIKDITISPQTVRNFLKRAGLKAVGKKKRPYLKHSHRKARMDFAEKYQHWTVEDWKRVIWSDETKINRFGSDGKKWVWKRQGEQLNKRLIEPTFKHGGGSLMMWGCMSWEGVGFAAKIDGRMDSDLYCSILEDELQQSIKFFKKKRKDTLFQQDNDPKHKSNKATSWFKDHKIQVMDWPAQSPDLNPIEHLWVHLKRQLAAYSTPPSGINELWERTQREWEAIDTAVVQNLIESMPRRVEEVIRAKGGCTNY
jgi:transposase